MLHTTWVPRSRGNWNIMHQISGIFMVKSDLLNDGFLFFFGIILKAIILQKWLKLDEERMELASCWPSLLPLHLVTLMEPGAVTEAPQTVEGPWKWMYPQWSLKTIAGLGSTSVAALWEAWSQRTQLSHTWSPTFRNGETRSATLSHYIVVSFFLQQNRKAGHDY